MGIARDCPNFFEYALLSQERVKLRTSNLAGIFTGSIEQKPFKNLGEYGAWANPGTPQFFEVSPITSGTGKATDVKFGRYIQRVRVNKSQLKIWEKMKHGRIQGLPKCFEYPLLSQERIKLRTSNLAGPSRGPSEQKPFKILGENGAWAYPGTAQIF